MQDITVHVGQVWRSSLTWDPSRYKCYSFISRVEVIMCTKSTLKMYLSNLLFWQSYHGWITFRFPALILSCPKLIWYRNIQLYTYLLVSGSLSSGSLQRFLKYLLTCYLLILLSGGGVSFVFVFVFL